MIISYTIQIILAISFMFLIVGPSIYYGMNRSNKIRSIALHKNNQLNTFPMVKPGNFMDKAFFEDLKRVAKEDNPQLEEILREHFNLIEIDNIEYTGVGCYVNFRYSGVPTRFFEEDRTYLASHHSLYINDFEPDYAVVFTLENGQLLFIEIVSWGDQEWHGEITKWRFE